MISSIIIFCIAREFSPFYKEVYLGTQHIGIQNNRLVNNNFDNQYKMVSLSIN